MYPNLQNYTVGLTVRDSRDPWLPLVGVRFFSLAACSRKTRPSRRQRRMHLSGSSLSRSWAITLRALSRCQSEDFLISHVPLVSHFFIFVDSNKRYHQEVRYLVAIVFIVCDDDQISMIAGLIGIITTLMLTSMLVSTSACLCFICCQCGL
ncbi:hypothetical protein L208DRAFT_342037 [Tricholoma matsutake]|nr:hypothetical protein L208DRAFT_342037 [Tricholoma matsutake 945]